MKNGVKKRHLYHRCRFLTKAYGILTKVLREVQQREGETYDSCAVLHITHLSRDHVAKVTSPRWRWQFFAGLGQINGPGLRQNQETEPDQSSQTTKFTVTAWPKTWVNARIIDPLSRCDNQALAC